MTLEQIISEHEREIGRLNTLLICPTLSDGTRKETFQKLKRSELILSALHAQQVREAEPKPLTLKELREREGKPVWCVDGAGNECWCIVNVKNGDCTDNEAGAWVFDFYALAGADGVCGLNKQLGWFAYDRPPEGAAP